jgi:hypothetical protein
LKVQGNEGVSVSSVVCAAKKRAKNGTISTFSVLTVFVDIAFSLEKIVLATKIYISN